MDHPKWEIVRVAVDAMGGDHAPDEIVKGAIEAAQRLNVCVILVGDKEKITNLLTDEAKDSYLIKIYHAPEIIDMHDKVDSIRSKPKSSIVIAASIAGKVHPEVHTDAFVGLGNTTCTMAAATIKIGRAKGVERPPIAAPIPHKTGFSILLDAGAVTDCTPHQLLQFAEMGNIYVQEVFGLNKPRIGLLSIGEEASKGNEATKAAHELIAQRFGKPGVSGSQFIGNIEGRDLFSGRADIIIADGFAGNVALKTAEGLGEYVMGMIKEEFTLPWYLKFLLYPTKSRFARVKKRVDYSEYGGAPLLGLKSVVIIGHGRSKAKAVFNAIKAAKTAVDNDVVGKIGRSLSQSVPDSTPVESAKN